jgi:glycosyltransferase involved in cell wall biosynthesis
MTNVLYIGNALQGHGKTQASIETLGKRLAHFCQLRVASQQRNKVLRLIDMLYSVWRFRRSTDIVLIDTYSTTNFYYALFVSQLCRILKLTYIPILHGGQLERRLKAHPKKSALLFKHAKHLVAPSPYLQSVFQSYGYDEVLYIPNSIELQQYPYVANRLWESITLLWVRSFSKIYNPMMALEVLDILRQHGHKAHLTMVGPEGDGSLNACKNAAKQKGLEVQFTGLLSKAEWTALSEQHNLFINTTNVDNTPVSVIEAMALGLPVVSTNVGGLPYLISHEVDGLLVPPNDPQAMADAIMRLQTDPKHCKILTQNARKKVEQFDWAVVKTQWQALLS